MLQKTKMGMGTGIPCTGYAFPHTIPPAWEQQEEEEVVNTRIIPMRSERSDKSNFPITCNYNRNFFNRKKVKYLQMHNIYLFIHILTVTARSDHLVNQYKEQLVFGCAAPFFSKRPHRCYL